MRTQQDLFTVQYAVEYDGWVRLDDFPGEEQFRNVYLWCNYLVYSWDVNYYLLLKIVDRSGNLVYEGHIPNLYQYNKLKKKLNFTNCTLKNVMYMVDENNVYLTDENNNFIIE